MNEYQVEYEIITHDADDWSWETKSFHAPSDEEAKNKALHIIDERRREIERKGSGCQTREWSVFRIITQRIKVA